MKKIKITETKLFSLFNSPGKDNFYQDGDFFITNDRMNKAREIFYPFFKKRYNEDKNQIIHQIAFSTTMRMLDNGEKLPEFGDYKMYHSIGNLPFSKKQVEYVENKIRHKYESMSLEELYDYMLITQERAMYDNDKNAKRAIAELINKGFFDTYLNGQLKDLALWNIGKLNDTNDMLVKLYSKNTFTGKLNIKTFENEIKKTKDEIANSNEGFMNDPIFLALDHMQSSMWKLNKTP